ncbi:MAG: membrane dipeptidase [Ardenticatenaceae bacterium]|nr:membrane dipeptidase [Anaerolineales bacterium]MCB8937775.1 membrane dipeptidase [Ardenticatenaceae bacterium]MCB8974344.1 membrane dipeptidase [Ardenticatenaceae bacterium]
MIIDGHLELAYDAVVNGRSHQNLLADLRAREKRRHPAGIATLTLPALAEAGVGLALGTIFAPPAAKRTSEFGYHTQQQAEQMAQAQLDYYHRLADENETIRLMRSQSELAAVVESWEGERPFLGIVPLLKGADPIREPEAVEMWFERGVRLIGLAWDDTAYASGFLRGSRFGLTKAGHQLLEIMADFGLFADASHLSEKAFFELLDSYPGPLIATQSNARALVPDSERHLSDTQIMRLGERGAVIGVSPYNPLLRRGHRHGDPKQLLTVENVVAHIDHICQVLGDAAHVGLGSGLGGPFGAADLPTGMDSVLDLAAIGTGLKERGYGAGEITAVLYQNWLRLLQNALPV